MYKKLIKASEESLELLHSKDYIELQNKFDKLYKAIYNDFAMLKQITKEIKQSKSDFVKSDFPVLEDFNEIKIEKIREITKIDNDIQEMNITIEDFNETIETFELN